MTTTNSTSDVKVRVSAMTAEALATTKAMAAECDDGEGGKRCYACGGQALVLVAPGYGGVWACRECKP